MTTRGAIVAAVVAAGLVAGRGRAQDEYERDPVAYSATAPDNAVERLQSRIDAGEVVLRHEERTGFLRPVLQALAVPVSSQALVFSKTSLQQQRISPRNPRALYFNDDVYVGYVRGGEVLEVSVADPRLGAVFYTLEQSPADRPRFVRQTDDCLICHGGSQTRGVPGHVVRSVYPERSGQPLFAAGSYRVDDSTPLRQRWGGWYVTGTHGAEPHLGNLTYRSRPADDGPADPAGLNVIDLGDRFDASGYLSAHSDLVALGVLVHQASAHNVITRAAFDSRAALHREEALNRELGEPPDHRWPSTDIVIDGAVNALLKCVLFCDAAPLTAPIAGTTVFAAEFAALGPADPQGRSLRTLDLRTRLFAHPCSFLVHGDGFAALPAEVRRRFWTRLDAVLAGHDRSGDFAHLRAEDRAAIREILVATHPGAPAHWRP